jgi:hypothetical protein
MIVNRIDVGSKDNEQCRPAIRPVMNRSQVQRFKGVPHTRLNLVGDTVQANHKDIPRQRNSHHSSDSEP